MKDPEQFQPSHTQIDEGKYSKGPYELGRDLTIKELIPSGQGQNAIDMGCGSGHYSQALSNKGWSVMAVDTDPGNVANARRFATEAILGDAISVLSGLPQNHVDLVLALEIIEHMPKAYGERLLREVRRVLKQGGELLLSTPNRYSPEGLGGYYWGEKIRRWGRWDAWDATHVHIYTSPEILRLLRDCGFNVKRVVGYWYEGRLPLIGRWRLPLVSSSSFPLNRLGFNIIVKCEIP